MIPDSFSLSAKVKKEVKNSGLNNLEYLEIRDTNELNHPKNIRDRKKLRVFVAVYVGKVRLIDNFKLS